MVRSLINVCVNVYVKGDCAYERCVVMSLVLCWDPAIEGMAESRSATKETGAIGQWSGGLFLNGGLLISAWRLRHHNVAA